MAETYVPKPDDLEPQKENPFLPDLLNTASDKVKMRTRGTVMKAKNGFVSQRLGIHDLATGEILDDESLVVAVKKAVDTEEFTKIFTSGVGALMNLSKRAMEVFTILIKTYNAGQLQGTNDLIYFTHQKATENGYTKGWHTFRSGVNELMHNKFMVPSTEGLGWYWINPTLFYRGDRITLVNQYVISEKLPNNAPDVKLDQINLFDGTTERERLSKNKE